MGLMKRQTLELRLTLLKWSRKLVRCLLVGKYIGTKAAGPL